MNDIKYNNVINFCSDLSSLYGLEEYKVTSSGLYSSYPKIFADIFPVSQDYVELFEILSKVYIDHILYVDNLCEGKTFSLEQTIEKYIEGNELVHKLSYVFQEQSPFWIEYRRLYKQYFLALKKEDYYKNNHNINIDKDSYLDICKNKGSLSKLLVYGMAILSENLPIYFEIEQMLDRLNIYIQILDDFKDIKSDISEGYLSYYTYKSLKGSNLHNYQQFLDNLIISADLEFLEDMKYYLSKCDDIFQKYKLDIPLFGEILQEQFKIVALIESKVNKIVCK